MVVEQKAKVIVYCPGGLTGRSESDAWVCSTLLTLLWDMMTARTDLLTMPSSLCDRSLVPADHEFS